MYNLLKKILAIFIIIFSKHAFSFNSSTYLVANTAVTLFDFDKAQDNFDLLENNLSESDFYNQLLTYINLNNVSKASSVAEKIISINEFNQEAWIAYLTNAIMTNNLSIFNSYKKIQKKSEMNILNYIFFNINGDIKTNNLIARSIYEVIQASVSKNESQISYKFLLFYLSIAIIIDPSFDEAYYYSAKIYQSLKNYSKAEFFYKKISINDNLFVDSQKNIAINKSKIGLNDEGIKLLKNLIENNKHNLSLILNLADLYRDQKNYKEAIKFYTKIINSKNNSFKEYWRIFYLRGICYERLKNWNLAEKDFLYSLEIKPNSPQVLNYLAYGWLERDLYLNKAMEMLKEAYQANPNSYYIADSLAWAYYKKKNYLKALHLMEKVILMAPGESVCLDHMGDIYYAINRKREASYFWKQAIDLSEPEDEIEDKIIKKLTLYNAG